MTAEQKAEIRWQKIVVEGRPVAEVAKELHETPETVLRNVRKDAENRKASADSSSDGEANESEKPEVLTPTERQRRKIVDAHNSSPNASDAEIAKEIGAPKATVNRVRKSLKTKGDAEKVVKNKTAAKPTIHDEFAKAVAKLSKAADDIVRLSRDPRAARSGAKLWETNGQELVAIDHKLTAISNKLQGKSA
jgi:IS30 family transposase